MDLTIEQALSQGITAHKAGKPQEAERLFKAILRSQPHHPDANHNLGVLAVSFNKVEAALPLFRKALDANSKIEQFWLSYIDALIKDRQFEVAKKAISDAKEKGIVSERLNTFESQIILPSSASVPSEENINGFFRFYKASRFTDAEKLATSLTQEFPGHPFGWQALGAVLKRVGKLRESLVANYKFVQLAPQDAESHINLGITLKQLGRLEEAEASLRQATILKPDFVEAHGNLGDALKLLGRLEEAEASYRQAIAIKPEYAEVHNNLGNTLKDLGRLKEAEASCRQAISLKTGYAEAHNNLGNILKDLGRLDEAETSLRQALALKPNFVLAHSNLGNILNELGRLEEAEASLRQALVLKPDFTEAHNNLGNNLKELGRLDEALASYRQAIVLRPNYAPTHNNLGIILKRLGKLEEAEASFKQAIALKPDFSEVLSNLGNTLQELGRLEEAKESYKKALTLKPDFAEAFWNLSGIEKTIPGAEKWIDRCLKVHPTHELARLTKAALRYYQGDRTEYNNLMQSELRKHPLMRSISWAFSLSDLPELFFDKWHFFDAIINQSLVSRPFYEFGVWRALSFKYLLKNFKKGYGFDTFAGLPEDWVIGNRVEKKGSYSSDEKIPKFKGARFISGDFEHTLPKFFSKSRPMASLINFDADLYSSTLCALNFSKSVIDEETILIFDELITHESWELHEFKALNEFCSANHLSYQVIAISFFTKQVAVKLIGI